MSNSFGKTIFIGSLISSLYKSEFRLVADLCLPMEQFLLQQLSLAQATSAPILLACII